MITVKRGKEKTEVILDGELGQLIMESISVVESLRNQIVGRVENSEEIIYQYVEELIDAAWGK